MTLNAHGPVAVITGASAGIGKSAARMLVGMGWQVIGTGRDPSRSAAAIAEIEAAAQNGGSFTMLRSDFDVMAQVSLLADEIIALTARIDALVLNAGGVRDAMVITPDGLEATFAANHVAHFLLTRKLMSVLEASGARVISTSSDAHEYCPAINWDDLGYTANYTAGAAYCQAKLANLLFTRELAKRGAAQGITANAIHPGAVTSNFWSHGDEVFQTRLAQIRESTVTPDAAAQTIVHLASSPEAAAITGKYYFMGALRDPSAAALDDAAAARLWDVSDRLLAKLGH